MLANDFDGSGANEKAFDDASDFLGHLTRADRRAKLSDSIGPDEHRVLPREFASSRTTSRNRARRRLASSWKSTAKGRGSTRKRRRDGFTIIATCLYLLPVIGFIGTVEGIQRRSRRSAKSCPW